MALDLIKKLAYVLLAAGSCLLIGRFSIAAETPCGPMTLDQLPRLPHDVSVHEFSSHNKKESTATPNGFSIRTKTATP